MIESLIDQIKNSDGYPVCDNEQCCLAQLVPLNEKTLFEYKPAMLMSQWRNRFGNCFLTQFHSTPERTLHWLTNNVILQQNKILFLIVSEGQFVGHVGLCEISENEAEIDNVINTKHGQGFFYHVVQTCLRLCFEQLQLKRVQIRYFSDNERAKRAYEKVFGSTYQQIDFLRVVENTEERKFIPCEKADSNTDVRYLTSAIDRKFFGANK